MADRSRLLGGLAIAVALVFLWSGWHPKDRLTWVLEVFPVVLALPILLATRRRFPLTTLVYVLIAIHAVVLMIGGRYTYAEVPLFNSIRDAFQLSRNHYDRVGHFVQGFVPAMIAREVLLRKTPLRRGRVAVLLGPVRRARDQRDLRARRMGGRDREREQSRRVSSAPRATRGTRRRTWRSPRSEESPPSSS
jgi:predicted membrane metal-binding protein